MDDIFVGYFCQDSPGHNTATAIAKALLYQLLDAHNETFHVLAERYGKLIAQRSDLQFHDLWKLLSTAVKGQESRTCFLVIDGLDECEESSQEQLWRAIERDLTEAGEAQKTSPPRLRILLTSRPTALARRIGLRTTQLEMERSDLDQDIFKFINHRIDYLTKVDLIPTKVAEKTRDFLNKGAEGMFLWTNLILNQLEHWEGGITELSLPRILEQTPRDVEGLYDRALEAASRSPSAFGASSEHIRGIAFRRGFSVCTSLIDRSGEVARVMHNA